jgi:amino acid adenylation domain-containing protein/non-ribosomal peptide synthase protein (TIGR01720 family)
MTTSNPDRLREIAQRLAALPEAKQATFEQWLAGQGIAVSDLPIVPVSRAQPLPLSFAQRRVWTLQQLDPDAPLYNVANVLAMSGPLDQGALERAFQQLVARHESLRTSFEHAGEEPVQRVHASIPFALRRVDLRAHPEQARAVAETEAHAPFDLGEGPLFRATLLQLAEQEHWLLMTLHHIVTDEWSDRILTDELRALYAAARDNTALELPALSLQYADYAVWQRKWMRGAKLDRQLAYWTQQLDAEYHLTLPSDRPTAQAGYEGASLEFALERALTDALRGVSARQGVTLFMTMLGVFQLLLARYSGQSDVRVGVPVANRHRHEVEPLIGFFANTQVLRSELHGGLRVHEFLARIKRTVSDAQENQDLPFERLVDVLRPERRPSLTPLFQVMLSWHLGEEAGADDDGALKVRAVGGSAKVAKFDLTLHLTDAPHGLEAQLIYRKDLYTRASIEQLAARFLVLARELCGDPQRRLAELSWFHAPAPDRARAQLPFTPITRLIEEGHCALQAHANILTHAELEAQATQLAAALQARGVGPGSRVGLLFPRSIELVVALYGVLKTGAAYVPLDPQLPAARRAALSRDTALVLTDLSLAAEQHPFRPLAIHPEYVAYVIFTSGSTGQPKGVEVTHGNLAQYVTGVLARMALVGPMKMAFVSSVAADLGHTTLFGALVQGGVLHVVPDQDAFDADRLADYLERHQIDVLKITPSHFEGVLHAERPARAIPRQLLIVGGEAISVKLVERARALGAKRVLNHYGPTEATVGALTYELDDTIALGVPLPQCEARVLDVDLKPLPAGAIGEIYIGGAGVARGYLGRPDLTADRFVPNPFRVGERLYRTGDRGCYRSDGAIEFRGRADDQVKLRGHRVELAEIELQLMRVDGVRAARVLVSEGALVAYLVGSAPEERLRTILSAQLPKHMVPSHFVALASLPLTPNGKLDRRALPAPQRAQREGVLPRTGNEAVLAEIWCHVLKRESVSVDDNFFRLGGDSLLAFQVIARARKAGLVLTPSELFSHQTIEALARVAGEHAVEESSHEVVRGEVMFSPMQRAFFARVEVEQSHWNQSLLLRVCDDRIDVELLERAFVHLLQHHDALRMRFELDGEPRQSYGELSDESLCSEQRLSLEELPEALDFAQRSLDLSRGRVIAATLFDLGERGRRLLIAAHHLVVDGVSWRILSEDLRELVEAELAAREPVLPARTSSFQAWSARLAQHVGDEAYWQRVVEGATPARLPTAKPGRNLEGLVDSVELSLDVATTRDLLTSAPAAYRTQVNDLLLTALALTVSGSRDEQACLVDLEGHGRQPLFPELDLSRSVGWFTSIHPLRLSADPRALGDSIKRIKEQLRAVPNQGVGAPPRERVLVFNYLGQLDQGFEEDSLLPLADESCGEERSPLAPRDRHFDVVSMVQAGALHVQWSYSREQYARADVEQLAAAYLANLRAVIEHCCARECSEPTPSDFPLARVSQRDLSAVFDPSVQGLFALTPVQQGILFHALLEPSSYITQRDLELDFAVDVVALERAFQRAIDDHDALRTSFVHEGLSHPLQRVHAGAQLPFHELEGDPEQFAEQDLARGFVLERAPLMRVTLIRLAPARYRLFWTQHHLVLDGWSCARVLSEVFDHYRAFAAGGDPARERRPQFGDYLAWLDKRSDDDFWAKQLQDFEQPSLLGSANPELASGTGRLLFQVGPPLFDRLQQAAQRAAVTMNTLVQGALAAVLATLTRTRDVVFGVTSAGRDAELANVERIVGLLIETVPLRVQLDFAQCATDYLQSVQGRASQVLAHTHTPLAAIQRAARLAPGTPLFDVLLVFENYLEDRELAPAAEALGFGELSAREHSHYPLTVQASVGSTLQLQLDYQRARVSSGRAQAVVEMIGSALHAIADDLPLALWPSTPRQTSSPARVTRPGPQLLHAAIEAQVDATPNLPALCFGELVLSYRELDRRANQLARALVAEGVAAEARVGVYLPRSPELVVALLAVLKAGGSYVPLEPELPVERVRTMIERAAPHVVLTVVALADRLGEANTKLLALDARSHELAPFGDKRIERGGHPEQLAYCIYTSGSTGEPKAVSVAHRAITNFLRSMAHVPGLRAGERVLALTPISFDIAALELFLPLCRGGCVVLLDREAARDPAALVREARKHGISLIQATPATWKMLVQDASWSTLPSCRAITGGEALSSELARALCEKHCEVWNVYGPTETTVWSTLQRIDSGDVTLGGPLDNTDVYVLGPRLEALPAGVVGELFLGGEGLARGYLGRPGLTAERFVPDPQRAGARIYRTGDLAALREDGALVYHGRDDFQIKVRGHRIELGEIESVLVGLPGVRDALVVANADSQLVAYVVGEAEQAALVDGLRRRLPDAMVPRVFVFLAALPLNSSGKVDRRALPAPQRVHGPRNAPRDERERALLAALEAVLRRTELSIDDNFFELGGDSISALRLVSQLRGLGWELRLQDVFAVETLALLAALLRPSAQVAEQRALELSLDAADLDDVFEEIG